MLADANGLVEAMKRAARDEREPRNVTDYMTTVTVQWNTEIGVLSSDGKTTAPPPHLHGIVGTKNFLMHNALEVGDEVILIRQQEGQKFIVIDRIGGK